MAEKSSYYPYRVGAVIYKGKRILGAGFNAVRSFSKINDKYKAFRESLHAEQHAMMNVKNWSSMKGASIIVVRINMSGTISLAKPCENCMQSIRAVKIKEIYYSDRNGQIILEKVEY